jgi:tetratricopeptide (TPR) repeat protein
MAIEDFTKAIKYDSSFAEAYLLRGVSYGKMDKISEAIADFSKASELRVDFAEAYYNRGLAYCKIDEFVKAIADFTQAIALQVDFDKAYNMRAYAFYQNENYDGAWNDIHVLEQMGYKISPEFVDNLRKVSGRKK